MYRSFLCQRVPYFGEDYRKLLYMDTGLFLFSFTSVKRLKNNVKQLFKNLGFSKLDQTHELGRENFEKVIDRMELASFP